MNAKELGQQKVVAVLRQPDPRAYAQAMAAGFKPAPYLDGGLTKRELFAAMAMQGLLANSKIRDEIAEYAEMSVTIADLLLAELAKDQP